MLARAQSVLASRTEELLQQLHTLPNANRVRDGCAGAHKCAITSNLSRLLSLAFADANQRPNL